MHDSNGILSNLVQVASIQWILRNVFTEGVHFEINKGAPTLLDAGAELIMILMGWRGEPSIHIDHSDYDTGIHTITVTMQGITRSGKIIGIGIGSASTRESKHWNRKSSNGEIIKNTNVNDLYNTVMKMASVRALRDLVMTCGAGSFFGQSAKPQDFIAMLGDVDDLRASIDDIAQAEKESTTPPITGTDKEIYKSIHWYGEKIWGKGAWHGEDGQESARQKVILWLTENRVSSLTELNDDELASLNEALKARHQTQVNDSGDNSDSTAKDVPAEQNSNLAPSEPHKVLEGIDEIRASQMGPFIKLELFTSGEMVAAHNMVKTQFLEIFGREAKSGETFTTEGEFVVHLKGNMAIFVDELV